MRRLIIKLYALGYKIGPWWVPRSMFVVMPYFFAGGYVIAQDPSNTLQWYDLAIIVGFIIQLYLAGMFPAVSYFKHFPVTWDELDNSQKLLYGRLNIADLTEEQFREWEILNEKL